MKKIPFTRHGKDFDDALAMAFITRQTLKDIDQTADQLKDQWSSQEVEFVVIHGALCILYTTGFGAQKLEPITVHDNVPQCRMDRTSIGWFRNDGGNEYIEISRPVYVANDRATAEAAKVSGGFMTTINF